MTKVEGGRASAGSHLLQNTYVKQGLFIVHCCACIAAFPGPRQLQLYRPAGQTPLREMWIVTRLSRTIPSGAVLTNFTHKMPSLSERRSWHPFETGAPAGGHHIPEG
jgi:hypothetical protein